jgi:hypothetical protein
LHTGVRARAAEAPREEEARGRLARAEAEADGRAAVDEEPELARADGAEEVDERRDVAARELAWAGRERCNVASTCVFRARAFRKKHPRFETVPRDDRSSKNQPKRVENGRDMSL